MLSRWSSILFFISHFWTPNSYLVQDFQSNANLNIETGISKGLFFCLLILMLVSVFVHYKVSNGDLDESRELGKVFQRWDARNPLLAF